VLFQVYLSGLVIVLSNDKSLLSSLGNNATLSKLLLILVGLLQSTRHKISFYHCIALSLLCQLLSGPTLIPYYVAKMGDGPDQGNRIIYVLYLVSALLLTFTLSLIPLLVTPGWCTSPTEVEWVWVLNEISGTPIWKTAIFFNCILNLLFERSIMLRGFFLRRGDTGDEDIGAVIGRLFITLVFFLVIPTLLLELTVSWLYEVSGGSDSVWDFGQILTFVTVIVATGAPIGGYLKAVSPTDPSVRGYHIFWNDGSSHCIHKSNLSMCQCERNGASSGPSRWIY
jgi:hypothetical protein